MFLRTLNDGGHIWEVELRITSEGTEAGGVALSFSRRAEDGEVSLSWRPTGEALEALSQEGVDVSDELLQGQLQLALAEVGSVDVNGSR